jgi:hypothetical protein
MKTLNLDESNTITGPCSIHLAGIRNRKGVRIRTSTQAQETVLASSKFKGMCDKPV